MCLRPARRITSCRPEREVALRYDRILLKEVVHHVAVEDLEGMYSGLCRQLNAGGRIVNVMRPHKVAYPFFTAALDEWSKHQPKAEVFASAMEAAGFVNVHISTADYVVTIGKKRWFQMISNRFWSTFSYFSDIELADGLEELSRTYATVEEISFTERIVFVCGDK
jgi:hypothetical protein